MNIRKTILAAVIATAAMTLYFIILPFTGLFPELNIATFLGKIAGDSKVAGWAIHIAFGFAFAFIYARWVNDLLPIESNVSRGVIYSIFVFLFSTVSILTINAAGLVEWHLKESMAMLFLMSLTGHLIYGAILGGMLPKVNPEREFGAELQVDEPGKSPARRTMGNTTSSAGVNDKLH
ncbi:MAG: DUF6789 family protein [Chitinophagales bacterium]